MSSQSTAHPGTIDYFKALANRYGLRIIAVSHEGRKLNGYRIKEFKLNELFHAFVSSCFVQLRKPDKDISRMAATVHKKHPDIRYV